MSGTYLFDCDALDKDPPPPLNGDATSSALPRAAGLVSTFVSVMPLAREPRASMVLPSGAVSLVSLMSSTLTSWHSCRWVREAAGATQAFQSSCWFKVSRQLLV